MHYEVEQKFRYDDLDCVHERLLGLGAVAGDVVEQVDCYYKHPVRDFAKTDEAFRLRRVGERNYMTYKGPKLDATTKTRREEEVRIADGAKAAAACDSILRQLAFEPAAIVRKRRKTLRLQYAGRSIEAALDDVAEVGAFVEFEISAESIGNDASEIDAARQALADLAAELGLQNSEVRSYLELLLARRE
jgi:adenylate cyclase class 2